jgi:hypothetical protein
VGMPRNRVAVLAIVSALAIALASCSSDAEPADSSASDTAKSVSPSESAAENSDTNTKALPIGDGNISKTPKRGYVMSCVDSFNGSGAQSSGKWISGDTWNMSKKPMVQGNVEWPNAKLKIKVKGNKRIITGNGLPDQPTGKFPVQESDPAYQYDRNPNSIQEQTVEWKLTANPKQADSASCLPMNTIGISTDGAAIFNALDAEGRDAGAHEILDKCWGHPEMDGSYHHHTNPSCLDDGSSDQHSPLLGYLLDGFGIYGLRGDDGEQMSNDNLDKCHGHEHDVDWNGEQQNIYHYHMTYEYPYTAGCFKGDPLQISDPGQSGGLGGPPGG